MKYTAFWHPSLVDMLRESCGDKFTAREIEVIERDILMKIQYRVEPLRLYDIVNRMVGHCLVGCEIGQCGVDGQKILEECYRTIVELYLCSDGQGGFTYGEIAYGMLMIVLDNIIEGKDQINTKCRILGTVRLVFNIDENKDFACYQFLSEHLVNTRRKYVQDSEFCYMTIVLSMSPLARP